MLSVRRVIVSSAHRHVSDHLVMHSLACSTVSGWMHSYWFSRHCLVREEIANCRGQGS